MRGDRRTQKELLLSGNVREKRYGLSVSASVFVYLLCLSNMSLSSTASSIVVFPNLIFTKLCAKCKRTSTAACYLHNNRAWTTGLRRQKIWPRALRKYLLSARNPHTRSRPTSPVQLIPRVLKSCVTMQANSTILMSILNIYSKSRKLIVCSQTDKVKKPRQVELK